MNKCMICGKELKDKKYFPFKNIELKVCGDNGKYYGKRIVHRKKICYSCFKKLNFKIILVNTTETNFFKKEFRKKKKRCKI